MRLTPNGTELAGEDSGEGPPLVLLHGLTATRRYVVSGSRYLERHGRRVIAYDARGHGESDPAPERGAYSFRDQVTDLVGVLDELGIERVALVGQSMGAAVSMLFAIECPDRVSALVQITPAHVGRPYTHPGVLARWDALADGLERDGVEGFMAAYDIRVDPAYRQTVEAFTRQRLERHLHPAAVADCIRVFVRDTAWEGLAPLEAVRAPVLIVATRDETDPDHPLEVARAYAERLPNAELHVDAPGESPLAWQGARVSRRIDAFLG